MSEHTAVFGLGWGDEGKGKVVDLLCPAFDLVVRFNGGANAGHTVCAGGEKFALHLLPTGVLHERVTSVVGPGVVIDPSGIVAELDGLASRGRDPTARLKISDRAHVVLPYHKIEDQLSERAAGEAAKIGTTSRGIGPCYADKMRRTSAVRIADLVYDDGLADRIRRLVADRKKVFRTLYGEDGGLDAEVILAELAAAKVRLAPLVCDTTALLHSALESGKRILFEGANGMLLDLDHGTYPFVTSSSTGPHGIGPGAGVPASLVSVRLGVTKAYATRVGSGPFVSELKDEVGDRIRRQGHEFGTTTGRPRRCGWFDAVANRYAVRLSGATNVALMHLDTLGGFDRVGICVAYELDGKRVEIPPSDLGRLQRVKPVFEYMPGWDEDLRTVRRFEDLPERTRDYVERIELLVGAPVSVAGVGPDRAQILLRGRVASWVDVPQGAAISSS